MSAPAAQATRARRPAVCDGGAHSTGTKAPARPTIPEVRGRIPAEVSARSLALGLMAFLAVVTLYGAAMAAVLFAPWWPLQIACAILAGLFIATMFVVGHDACHGSLTPSESLNNVLARIAFLPSWTPYRSWDFAHNRVHHAFTNLLGKDYAWAPLSKDEYDRLTRLRRGLKRSRARCTHRCRAGSTGSRRSSCITPPIT